MELNDSPIAFNYIGGIYFHPRGDFFHKTQRDPSIEKRKSRKGGTTLICKYSGEIIAAYLDGEVTPDVRSEIEEHLETCAGCQQVLHVQQSVKQNLKQSFGNLIASGEFKSRIFRALEDCMNEERAVEDRKAFFTFSLLRQHAFYPVAVAAIVILFLFLPGFPSTDINQLIFDNSNALISTGALLAVPNDLIRVLDIDESGLPDEDVPNLSSDGFRYIKSCTFMFQNVRCRLYLYQKDKECLCLWQFDCIGRDCEQLVDSFFVTNKYLLVTDLTSKHICPKTNKVQYLNMVRGECPCKEGVFALVGTFSHSQLLNLSHSIHSR